MHVVRRLVAPAPLAVPRGVRLERRGDDEAVRVLAASARGGTSGGCGGRSQSRTFGCSQTSRISRAAACSSRGPPASNAAAKSVRNIDSGGTAASAPRSTISRSIVVPDRSLPTMKNGSGIDGAAGRVSCAARPRRSRAPPARSRPPTRARARASAGGVADQPLAGDHRARQPVDQVLERQHLRDPAQEAGRVVGVVEDARDEDQRQERGVDVRRARSRSSGSRATARRRATRSRSRRARRTRPARPSPAASRARTRAQPAAVISPTCSAVFVIALPAIPAR